MITLRWVAIFGQIGTIAFVKFYLGYNIAIYLLSIAVVLSITVNFILHFQGTKEQTLETEQIPYYLIYDLGQLTTILFLTGGLNNPFSVLILAPVSIAAAILPRNAVALLCAMDVLAIAVLALSPYPLPWFEKGIFLPPTLLLGHACALLIATFFISFYIWYVAHQAKQLSSALTITQLALAKEQRLASLGALAAAAAHELGSPLCTIAVAAKELLSALPLNSSLREDACLISDQTERCRLILQDLAKNFSQEHELPCQRLPLSALVELAAEPYKIPAIEFLINGPLEKEPLLSTTPELMHALRNILQNAFHFAKSRVIITLDWSQGMIYLKIHDDGPGYPPSLISRLGEPYLFGRSDQDPTAKYHLGLGLFIALTLFSKLSARVTFSNDAGAVCLITLPQEIQ
jgi:two-component system sensor histidine kinase RegB